MRLCGIEGFWGGLGCWALVYSVAMFFVVMVDVCFLGDPARQKAKVEAEGEGDIEMGLAGDAGGNDDTKVHGTQVDEKIQFKN